MGVEVESDGVLGLFQGGGEPPHILRRDGSVVDDAELRRLDVAEDGDHLLLEVHHQRQLMQAEVGVAVARGEDGDAHSAAAYTGVDFVEQLVAGFHSLAVEERADPELEEVVIEQRRHRSLRVRTPMVDEHVERRRRRRFLHCFDPHLAFAH